MKNANGISRKFNATIEILKGQRAAIVELTDAKTGEWAGGARIEIKSGNSDDLYEYGYTVACRSAYGKGGDVETYRQIYNV